VRAGVRRRRKCALIRLLASRIKSGAGSSPAKRKKGKPRNRGSE
jgi:hypothetical protein